MDEDEAIMGMLAAVGTDDVAVARQYLEMAGFDVNAAVALYLDMSGGCESGGIHGEASSARASPSSSSGPQVTSPTAAGSRSTSQRVGGNKIPHKKAGKMGKKRSPKSPSGGGGYEDDDVAKALPSFHEQLLHSHDSASIRLNFGSTARGSSSSACSAAEESSAGVEQDSSFATLFAPPVSLVCDAPFAQACEEATLKDQYILVNIQSDSEFACLALNRDIWRDDTVHAVVVPNFLFWQRSHLSPQGEEFCRLYRVSTFPHIAAIDSRTGRQICVWPVEKFTTVDDAVGELIAFIEKQNDKKEGRASSTGNPNNRPSTSPKRPKVAVNSSAATEAGSTDEHIPSGAADAKGEGRCVQESGDTGNTTGNTALSIQYGAMNEVLGDLHKARQQRQQRRNSQDGDECGS